MGASSDDAPPPYAVDVGAPVAVREERVAFLQRADLPAGFIEQVLVRARDPVSFCPACAEKSVAPAGRPLTTFRPRAAQRSCEEFPLRIWIIDNRCVPFPLLFALLPTASSARLSSLTDRRVL